MGAYLQPHEPAASGEIVCGSAFGMGGKLMRGLAYAALAALALTVSCDAALERDEARGLIALDAEEPR